jgi:hypothetical protein
MLSLFYKRQLTNKTIVTMKRGFKFLLFAAALALLWGCYPQGPDYAEEMDVVLTTHNDEYDFVSKATYARPDRIVKITGNLEDGEDPEFIPDVYATKILKMIDDNMAALGWTKIDVAANPDLFLFPASWETTTVFYWYDYWGWWYGGYYPGWGYGGYYPPYYMYSSYTTASVMMTLIDPDVVGGNGNPLPQWTGVINGLLTGVFDETRVETAIDKAFTISPYLNTK